jgi:hypothetical protein
VFSTNRVVARVGPRGRSNRQCGATSAGHMRHPAPVFLTCAVPASLCLAIPKGSSGLRSDLSSRGPCPLRDAWGCATREHLLDTRLRRCPLSVKVDVGCAYHGRHSRHRTAEPENLQGYEAEPRLARSLRSCKEATAGVRSAA